MNPQRNAAFRPDPRRGVFLSEIIVQATLDRLAPIVLRLQSESRGPISLFIDSPGGSVASAVSLHRILKSTDQDGNAPCRLVTVAVGMAASAAADLLMSGDYAIAYPHARILCHGVREMGQDEALTHEKASQLAKSLANSNERFAIQLADNCISRFIFRVAALSSGFATVRERLGRPDLPNPSCLIETLRGRISPGLIEVLEQALKRSTDNDSLDLAVSESLLGVDIGPMPRPEFEVLLLKTIIDYEAKQHAGEDGWSLRIQGLEIIGDKLDLLLDKYTDHHSAMTSLLCDRWGEMFLTAEQALEVAALPDRDKPARTQQIVSEPLEALGSFLYRIQLTPRDDSGCAPEEAYWLRTQ